MPIPGRLWTSFLLMLAALSLPVRGSDEVFTAEHTIPLPGGGFAAEVLALLRA